MKKVLLFIMVFSIFAMAESCYKSNEPGQPKLCTEDGYICKLGIDVKSERNAVFFYLSSDAACHEADFIKSSEFATTLKHSYVDPNGTVVQQTLASAYTKFFFIDDGILASPLSMTVAGSIALSAYNNSSMVSLIYRMFDENDDTEYGGVRVATILFKK